MNPSQIHAQIPQRSSNWNPMALPPFGFIFSLPEPPSDLQLPAEHNSLPQRSHFSDASSLQNPHSHDELFNFEPSQQSLTASRSQSRRPRKSESDKRVKSRAQPHSNPVSALQRGNSDPFSAAGIVITPQVNQILAFARDLCLPAFYLLDSLRDSSISAEINRDVANSSGWISSTAAQLCWQQVVDAMSDKCTALVCLSTYLALMSTCNINASKATENSLKMRAGSSALLRQRLLQCDPQKMGVDSHRGLLWLVFWHFYAEFFSGNMVAAQVHGKMLRQSCETAEKDVISGHFLDSLIFIDFHMVAKYLTRPVLDIETWVPHVFAPIWERVDCHLSEITGENEERLHHCIDNEPLRAIFTRARQAPLLLQRHEKAQLYDIDYETIYYWLNSHSYVDSGILIDRYLKLAEQAIMPFPSRPVHDHSDRISDSVGAIHTQAALCLSALYAIREISPEVRINGVDVVDASSTITKHLKEALGQARAHCTTDEITRYRPAHLWCAFVGALNEQRLALPKMPAPPPPRSDRRKINTPAAKLKPAEVPTTPLPNITVHDPSTLHFNHLLAVIAHGMNLFSWQQVSEILKHFILSDLSEPHGSRWFWKTMGTYLDGRRKDAKAAAEKRRAGMAERESTPDLGMSLTGGQGMDTNRGSIMSQSQSGRSTPAGQRQGETSDRADSLIPIQGTDPRRIEHVGSEWEYYAHESWALS